jgi:cysteine sulfinate desulfinase/cysteine desulfurase-like protein
MGKVYLDNAATTPLLPKVSSLVELIMKEELVKGG